MKWSQEHVDLATDIVNAAPSRMVGYNLAANAIGTTETAVRCLMQRIDGARPVQRKADRGDHDELAVHKLRTQVTDLQAAKKRLLKDLADREDQIATLAELRKARPLKPIVAPKRVDAKQRRGVPVMLCSDLHVEERVDPAQVNGLNEYNLDIADRCIGRMAEAYEWLLHDARYDCREGVVWIGGDTFSGTSTKS